MDWMLAREGESNRRVAVSSDVLEWIAARTPGLGLPALDPYVDARLDRSDLSRWRSVLDELLARLHDEARASIAQREHLPRDPEARERVLEMLAAGELGSSSRAAVLKQMLALVDEAQVSGAPIECFGE